MKVWSKIAALTAACMLAAVTAKAAEITVAASGGPLPDVMGTLVPMFEKASGHKVKISFKAQPAISADVKQGVVDLIVTNTEVVDELAKSGDVDGNAKTLLMISKVGLAAALRGRDELQFIEEAESGPASVIMTVVDRLDDAVIRELRARQARGQTCHRPATGTPARSIVRGRRPVGAQ